MIQCLSNQLSIGGQMKYYEQALLRSDTFLGDKSVNLTIVT